MFGLPVCSGFVSPAMLIGVAAKLNNDDTEEEDLYEELNAQNNLLLPPISCGIDLDREAKIQKVDKGDIFDMVDKTVKVEV